MKKWKITVVFAWVLVFSSGLLAIGRDRDINAALRRSVGPGSYSVVDSLGRARLRDTISVLRALNREMNDKIQYTQEGIKISEEFFAMCDSFYRVTGDPEWKKDAEAIRPEYETYPGYIRDLRKAIRSNEVKIKLLVSLCEHPKGPVILYLVRRSYTQGGKSHTKTFWLDGALNPVDIPKTCPPPPVPWINL